MPAWKSLIPSYLFYTCLERGRKSSYPPFESPIEHSWTPDWKHTALETSGDQTDNRRYSRVVIYSDCGKDCDSREGWEGGKAAEETERS